jgi:NDP-sugar pyrophosphorylase family protein
MNEASIAPEGFFDLVHTKHAGLFAEGEPVWTALHRILPYLERFVDGWDVASTARISPRAEIGHFVRIGEGTVVEPFATIKGPAWIGDQCTIRSGAYLREGVIAGDGVMFGNSCEFKNCLLFDHAEVPHFNYVGDSILGYKAHLGAGVILSNVRLDRDTVIVDVDGERISSELRKFGAIVGDYAEIGCNSVLSPGSLIGRHSVLYPGSQWRGSLPSGSVVKVELRQEVVPRK